jgi:predicted transcriptional regulator
MKKFTLLLSLFVLTLGLAACKDKEGPAQKEGKQLDQAISKTNKNNNDKHSLQKAGKQLDQAAQKLNKQIKEQKPGEKAGKQLDKALEQVTDDKSSN